MKTTPKRILALLLALGLLLSLCACGQKEQTVPDEPKMSTDKVDLLTKADKKTPERQPEEAISQSDMSDRVSRDEATETQPVQYGFSQEAENSLGWLRDRIDVTGVMFGAVSYVGLQFKRINIINSHEAFYTTSIHIICETNSRISSIFQLYHINLV